MVKIHTQTVLSQFGIISVVKYFKINIYINYSVYEDIPSGDIEKIVRSKKPEVTQALSRQRRKYEWDQTMPPCRASDIFNSPVLAPGMMKYI